uniref:Phosphodiesterase 12 n=1 Tax=Apteryx owenii TaxID=8824 RepID=A0A8B9Q548_APTOW
VSYNILADAYAQTEFSRTVLYPYCAPYALELDYRQNLLKKELAGYSADLVCLQEVDRSAFAESLAPALDAFGLEGYKRWILWTGLPQKHKLLIHFFKYIISFKTYEIFHFFIQVSVLQSATDPSRKICVANTHLYWHPKGGNIRLIQIAIALSHIKHIACDLYPSIPIIFCGDFNSTPSSGAYSFINSGSIGLGKTIFSISVF